MATYDGLTDSEIAHSRRCHIFSTYSVLTTRVNGTVSAIASTLLILVILKSETKLKTIYHRIIFGMSCADVLASIATALNTLPMPKRGFYGTNALRSCYDHWPVIRLGNAQTCEAQGFCFYFGYSAMMYYNGSLCAYYACAIAFQMREQKIRKFVEPFFHLLPFAVGLAVAIPPLLQETYNPSGWDAYCTIQSIGCPSDDQSLPCYRGQRNQEPYYMRMLITSTTLLCATIVLSLLLVVCRVVQVDRYSSEISRTNPASFGHRGLTNAKANAKAVLIQSLCYLFALVLVTIFPILMVMRGYTDPDRVPYLPNLKVFFMPLAGLFNFLTFISHKIYAIQKVGADEKGCWKIFVDLMTGKSAEPIHVARISLVLFHENKKRVEISKKRFEMHFHNELGDDGVISYVSDSGSQWGHLEDTGAENVDSPSLDTNSDHNSIMSSQYLSNKSRSVKSQVSGVAGTSSNGGELLSFQSTYSSTFSKFGVSSVDGVSTS